MTDVALRIADVRGFELHGVVTVLNAQIAPTVTITHTYGTSEVTADIPRGESEWAFRYALPPRLFDGEVHVITVTSQLERGLLGFVGDPKINRDGTREAPGSFAADDLLNNLRFDRDRIRQRLGATNLALQSQATALQTLLASHAAAQSAPAFMPFRAAGPPVDLQMRYGNAFPAAMQRLDTGRDYLWFGVIDWDFRKQRPQHLASHLADAGNRIFYFSLSFERADEKSRFRLISWLHGGVFEVRLRLDCDVPANIYGGFTSAQVAQIQKAIDELIIVLGVRAPVAVVQYPSWFEIAAAIPGATVVHDCLDYVAGFSNVPKAIVEIEEQLIASADLVVAASQPLADLIEPKRHSVVIRNAAEVDVFANAANERERSSGNRPVIGYFGAIAEWFEISWIAACARSRPDWDFVLIGSHHGCDVSVVDGLANVKLMGEQPYPLLPGLLATFDVAIIPFQMNELTRCTNPVKLYEYMAAGKPVVASPMPEVTQATELVYIAADAKTFELQIALALSEDSQELRLRRQEWALGQSWKNRARAFAAAVNSVEPKVSVVVLTYNNWAFTAACLHSLLTLSDYPRLEIIVVDNASTDETREKLAELEENADPRLRIILNDTNVGFAAGNNVGLRAATGDVLVLLNNDTYVTRGWVRELIRPLLLDLDIGLVGPLTNNIGNEQKVAIHYGDMLEMESYSRAFTRRHFRHRTDTENLAFFCVALRRDVFEKVGPIDEVYGLGFFEDDDYCQLMRAAGYRLVIADDAFVHHHLSASFNALGAERKERQMARNRAIYEKRWGKWKPHKYRAEPGFGE